MVLVSCDYTRPMHVGALSIELYISGCSSLKQKRSRLKPLLIRLGKEFNVSAAEIDLNDLHRAAEIACVTVSNDPRHVQKMLETIPPWIERQRPDLQIVDYQIRMI